MQAGAHRAVDIQQIDIQHCDIRHAGFDGMTHPGSQRTRITQGGGEHGQRDRRRQRDRIVTGQTHRRKQRALQQRRMQAVGIRVADGHRQFR